MAYLDESGLSRFWTHIMTKLGGKVDKEEGKGLSSNDFTTAEKDKLAGLNPDAGKVTVDSSLNSTSTNPVENKAIYSGIYDPKTEILLKDEYGDIYHLSIQQGKISTTKDFYKILCNDKKIHEVGYLTYTLGDTIYPGDFVLTAYYHSGETEEITSQKHIKIWSKSGIFLDFPEEGLVVKNIENTITTPWGVEETIDQIVVDYDNKYPWYFKISIIEPPPSPLFDSSFSYYDGDTTFEGEVDSSLIDISKEYKAIFEFGSGETLECPVIVTYDDEENYYRFYTENISHPNTGWDLSMSLYYYESTGDTNFNISYEGYDEFSGRIQIVEGGVSQ